MKTEQMVIFPKEDGTFHNSFLGFKGTKEEAENFASAHNFSGGIHIHDPKPKRTARQIEADGERGASRARNGRRS